jgi:hypothetical protein
MTKTQILVIFSMFSWSLLAQKKLQSVSIQTSAVCEMCEDLIINKTLAFEKGIKFAEMDVKTGLLGVRFRKDKTSLNHIRSVISQLGYSADSVKANPKAYEALHFCCKAKHE